MSASLEAGLIVTLVGMGVVFVLLSSLVGIIHAMSRLSGLIEGRAATAPAGAPQPAAIDDEIVGVIGAAIRMYRRRHGDQG